MYNLIKSLAKVGLNAENNMFSFGYYFDGKDHDFSFPCAVVRLSHDLSGAELSSSLEKLNKVEKKLGYSTYDKRFTPDGWTLFLIRNDYIEEGRKGYGETIAFRYGFFMKRHEDKNATDDELIAAGHAAMIEKGYAVRQ